MSTRFSPAAMALFGTSADPPTIGHQAILAGLARRYPMVATWASDNPLKRHGAPLTVRRQLLRVVVDGLRTRMMDQGCRLELRQDFSSRRALDSVRAARACFPTARLLFVVGVDLLPQIPNWYQSSELLRCCCLAVVPRNNGSGQEQAMARLQAAGARLEALPLHIPPVASSQIRQRPDPALVPEELLPLLASHRLYGFTAHDIQTHAAHQ